MVSNLICEPFNINSIIVSEKDSYYETDSSTRRKFQSQKCFEDFKSIQKLKLMDDKNIRDRKFDEIAANLFDVKEMNFLLNQKIENLKIDVSNIKVTAPAEIMADRADEVEAMNHIQREIQEVKEKLNQLSNLFIHTNRRSTLYGSKSGLVPPKK